MASNKNNPKADPSDLTRRVWIIETRPKIGGEVIWALFEIVREELWECYVIQRCAKLSETHTGNEFRYRAATLTFDDDGSKCVIY